jgi:hypothetical protein
MKVQLIYKDLMIAVKEITRANNQAIDETRNLIAHLEKNTKDILNQCRENLALCRCNSENLENFIEKYGAEK